MYVYVCGYLCMCVSMNAGVIIFIAFKVPFITIYVTVFCYHKNKYLN